MSELSLSFKTVHADNNSNLCQCAAVRQELHRLKLLLLSSGSVLHIKASVIIIKVTIIGANLLTTHSSDILLLYSFLFNMYFYFRSNFNAVLVLVMEYFYITVFFTIIGILYFIHLFATSIKKHTGIVMDDLFFLNELSRSR